MSGSDAAPAGRMRQALGSKGWIEDASLMAPYLRESRGLYQGRAAGVARPADTAQVAEVVRLCREVGLKIVPQGGNTGLCGGASTHADASEIILSLGRMNRIREIDAANYTITVEAGCVLQRIQDAAREADRLFPLSLAAQGSCQIGGNLSTNAGGTNVLRYGNTRDLALGLEVVLPDGRVWDGLTGLRKDNSGYDLKDLFIGAEGTLGVITAAVLKLYPVPRDVHTALVALEDPASAVDLLGRLRDASGEAVTGFELIGRNALEMATRHVEGCRDPMDRAHPWYVLVELSSSRPDSRLRDVLEQALGQAFEDGRVSDAVLAESEAQSHDLWHLRESIPEGEQREGASIKHDVSVAVSRVPELIARATQEVERVLPEIRACPFGHIGDGNIHFNLTQPPDMDPDRFLARWDEFNRIVHDVVADLGGSFSAEHGIGRLKLDELTRYKSAVAVDLMRALKGALDPDDLFNPGKVVPPAETHRR
ncbi:MAG TPA: FAD-binding oxidoreductase [Gammaproteobacteria bacterium]|nr:FAD-binding oxidoreductase [Gammaproteobacteria bacterium]